MSRREELIAEIKAQRAAAEPAPQDRRAQLIAEIKAQRAEQAAPKRSLAEIESPWTRAVISGASQFVDSKDNFLNKVDNFARDKLGTPDFIDDDERAVKSRLNEAVQGQTGVAGGIGAFAGDSLLTAPAGQAIGSALGKAGGALLATKKGTEWSKKAASIAEKATTKLGKTRAAMAAEAAARRVQNSETRKAAAGIIDDASTRFTNASERIMGVPKTLADDLAASDATKQAAIAAAGTAGATAATRTASSAKAAEREQHTLNMAAGSKPHYDKVQEAKGGIRKLGDPAEMREAKFLAAQKKAQKDLADFEAKVTTAKDVHPGLKDEWGRVEDGLLKQRMLVKEAKEGGYLPELLGQDDYKKVAGFTEEARDAARNKMLANGEILDGAHAKRKELGKAAGRSIDDWHALEKTDPLAALSRQERKLDKALGARNKARGTEVGRHQGAMDDIEESRVVATGRAERATTLRQKRQAAQHEKQVAKLPTKIKTAQNKDRVIRNANSPSIAQSQAKALKRAVAKEQGPRSTHASRQAQFNQIEREKDLAMNGPETPPAAPTPVAGWDAPATPPPPANVGLGPKPRAAQPRRGLGKALRSNTLGNTANSAVTSAMLADEGETWDAAKSGAAFGGAVGGARDIARVGIPRSPTSLALLTKLSAVKSSGAERAGKFWLSNKIGSIAKGSNQAHKKWARQFSNKDTTMLTKAIQQMRNVAGAEWNQE